MRIVIALLCALIASPIWASEVGGPAPSRNVSRTSSSDWIGFAVSPTGRAFQSDLYGSESGARSQARQECETATVRTCSAIAVQPQTDVIVVHCRNGRIQGGYLGGSNQGYGGAEWIALDKARQAGFSSYDCNEVYRY